MKTFTTFALSFLLAIMLIAPPSNCTQDIKLQIGEQFLEALKTHGLELFKANLNIWQEFSEKLLNELQLTATEKAELLKHKKFLDELIQNFATMNGEELTKAVQDVITKEYGAVKSYVPKSINSQTDNKAEEAFNESFNKSEIATKKFVEQISVDWSEIYKTLPATELDKHKEYKEINGLMIKASTGDGAAIFELWQALVKFFGYKDWLYIFGLSQEEIK